MARIKLDENIPNSVAAVLRDADHEVHSACDEGLGGATDDAIIEAAGRERRVLVTLDLDFADVIRHDPTGTPGVIVLRPHQPLLALILVVARAAATFLNDEEIDGRLWIIDEGRLRIWPGYRPA